MHYVIDEYAYVLLTLSQKNPSYTVDEMLYLAKFGLLPSFSPIKIVTPSITIPKKVHTVNNEILWLPIEPTAGDFEFYKMLDEVDKKIGSVCNNDNKKYTYTPITKQS